jgi:hypothetical protein
MRGMYIRVPVVPLMDTSCVPSRECRTYSSVSTRKESGAYMQT